MIEGEMIEGEMGYQEERTSSAEARAEEEATDEIWERGEERPLCVCLCVFVY